MLRSLVSLSSWTNHLKTPRLYYFNSDTGTQILEDFPMAISLYDILGSSSANLVLSRTQAVIIGYELAKGVQALYDWSSLPAQNHLAITMQNNEPMRKLKHSTTYETFVSILSQFSGALEGIESVVEEVEQLAVQEFNQSWADNENKCWGLIHGDLWTGK